MSRRRRARREASTLSLSFLDAVTCGFGAIILLLVITKIFEPIRLEESDSDLTGLIVKYEDELNQILGETERIRRQQRVTEEQLELSASQTEALERELARIRAAYLTEQSEAEVSAEIAAQLAAAKQSLTDEMERLIDQNRPRPRDYVVGGIPVDSEYIIFLIDTSPSMKRYEWDRVQEQLRETLEVYPTVKGIQVLNDQGEHMFLGSRNEWMEDSPQQRARILEELRNWDAFSQSNPRRGILEAISRYWDPDKQISLYVYSDDFAQGGGTVDSVVREVDARNRANPEGKRMVRIHAVAFPVYWDATGSFEGSGEADYAVLMRILCQRNGGTFVALPSRRAD
jgi:hypothetical protein